MKPMPAMTQKQVDRFWSKVNIKGPDECWEWSASGDRNGYGQFRVKCIYYVATRIAFWIVTSVDPDEQLVCHECDNPPCCNPAHLFLGSTLDNQQDKARKGRSLSGEANPSSKITVAMVKAIRASDDLQRVLAKRYRLTQSMISKIKLKQSWADV